MALRDLLLWFMSPATKAAAEAESRQWMATCSNCHKTESIWDLGGVRYKAAGRPVMRIRCPNCRQWANFHVFWAGAPKPQGPWFLTDAQKLAAEAESKQWVATCPHCHDTMTVWEMGGLEYKAAGGTKVWWQICPHCGKGGAFHLRRADAAVPRETPTQPQAT